VKCNYDHGSVHGADESWSSGAILFEL